MVGLEVGLARSPHWVDPAAVAAAEVEPQEEEAEEGEDAEEAEGQAVGRLHLVVDAPQVA